MRRRVLRGVMPLGMICLVLVLGQCKSPEGFPVVYLPQGWNGHDRQVFWYTSQGSRLIRYDWFLALEQAAGTEPFRSDKNMDRLGFLPQKPSPANPDGLPIGFAKDTGPAKRTWMGWTCAACHTGQIHYKGTRLQIEGSATLADVWTFLNELAAAMRETADGDEKFERFAKKVLKKEYSEAGAKALRKELLQATGILETRQKMDAAPHPPGHGRIDAFGSIFNQVLAANLGLPENARPADAPVSYPSLWDAPYSEAVQWNGSASGGLLGSTARNIGQALGVFATVEVDPKQGIKKIKGYRSSINVNNQVGLEGKVKSLLSPLWPEKYLPAIDRIKAGEGQAIYQKICQTCHPLIVRTDPKRRVPAALHNVGTDPKMVSNYIGRVNQWTGPLQGTRELILLGPVFQKKANGTAILRNQVIGTLLGVPWGYLRLKEITAGNRRTALAEIEELFEASPDPRYRARPHNGIWATAPYLHNGSVPNLWELLQPAEKRVKKFRAGSREFDPVHVGFESGPSSGGSEFDTGLPGNSNQGHDFAKSLSDQQRWALIEYLKTL